MPPKAEAWRDALRQAARRRDWEALSLLDGQLQRQLATGAWQPADEARRMLAETYRELMALRQAEANLLQQRLHALDQQREAQLAYAQVSDWNDA
ncbi:ABC transporter substrate-binding protein [Xenophilus sp. AP218F]|nr:ABC transporter substrate-binding protein [Chromobacterium sp. ASV5]OWY39973.1 ABC transporter substrate-binding protein [Xenophilus sp. AP218F]